MAAPKHAPGTTYYVRLLGTKRDTFIEFEFAIDDPELAVELVMPFEEFTSFCTRYDVTFLEPDPKAALAFEQLTWRHGEPALERIAADASKTGGER